MTRWVAEWLVRVWGTHHGPPPEWMIPLLVYTYRQSGSRRRIAESLLAQVAARIK
jgi:hypothetical protein